MTDFEQQLSNDLARQAVGPLTAEQVRRWAGMIANGEDEFPNETELPLPDRDRLAGAVRNALRERLLDLFAGAIARDLLRHSPTDTEV